MEIRIYVEGGGDSSNQKSKLRMGFSNFFQTLINQARSRRIKWNLIPSGSRNNAYRNFINALTDHPDACNLLLVDSEAPVTQQPWQHLQSRDNWDSQGLDDRQCHLMVQAMEAWFIADIDALSQFYGQGFQVNSIPRTSNIENIPKDSLEPSLNAATRNTTKGEYQKIEHGWKLLGLINVQRVRTASVHCDRLFQTITEMIDDNPT